MRKTIIAGNWKMHFTIKETVEFIEKLKDLIKDSECEVIICPSFVCLEAAKKAASGSKIKIGAQNMHFENEGAYTGEVSPKMLKALDIDYVILGHSERRLYFNESSQFVNRKIKAALENQLKPILCLGESLRDRETNVTNEVVAKKLKVALYGIEKENMQNIVVAYEPLWAIGTGRTATADDANETISFIRNCIAGLYDQETAEGISILYGGSVKPATIKEQMTKSDIDGALVGGASLSLEDFSAIINY
jgi:triosephosphate isomerase